jgi:hypothetical protein
VEYATLEWVAWFNTCRLLEPLGYLPSAEYELQFARQGEPLPTALPLLENSTNWVSGEPGAVQVVVDSTLGADQQREASALSDRVRSHGGHVVVVLLDADLALPFLRRVTDQPRSSFALSGVPGRMWLVTLANGHTSAIRGSF